MFLISPQKHNYAVGSHKKHITKDFLMSTYSTCICGEIRKIIYMITPLILSSVHFHTQTHDNIQPSHIKLIPVLIPSSTFLILSAMGKNSYYALEWTRWRLNLQPCRHKMDSTHWANVLVYVIMMKSILYFLAETKAPPLNICCKILNLTVLLPFNILKF